MTPLKRICAWCGVDLGPEDGDGALEEAPITHGMCLGCAAKMLSGESDFLQVLFDKMGIPVLMKGPHATLHAANKLSSQLLSKNYVPGEKKISGPGDLISCIYAAAPKGCGTDFHCKSCTIRNTVLETYQTGKPFIKVKAYPDVQFGVDAKTVCFEITTEKFGDFVLLRVDDLRNQDGRDPAALKK